MVLQPPLVPGNQWPMEEIIYYSLPIIDRIQSGATVNLFSSIFSILVLAHGCLDVPEVGANETIGKM